MKRIVCGLILAAVGTWMAVADASDPWAPGSSFWYASSIAIQNVSGQQAEVSITYATPCDPATPDYKLILDPGGFAAVDVNDAFPGPWNSAAVVTSSVPIIAQRNMTWREPGGCEQKALATQGVPSPATKWYLPEGNTWGSFDTWIVIQNPNESPAQIGITYVTDLGEKPGPTIGVEPVTTGIVRVSDSLPDWSSFSATVTSNVPVVAQSSIVRMPGWSTQDVVGISSPSNTWYFAEGSTSSGFDTWLVVQNVNQEAVNVDVDYVTPGGWIDGPKATLPPMTRQTIYATDFVPDAPHFAAIVTADAPIVAIQRVHWGDDQGMNVMPGVPAPSAQWTFADSSSASGYSTWYGVQNVGGTSANVWISYTSSDGTQAGPSWQIEPFARQSVGLTEFAPEGFIGSVSVTSDGPVLAVQGTMWQCGSFMSRDVQLGATEPASIWYLPGTPPKPPMWMSTELPPSDPGRPDRDGDGVPDDEDFCPDWPGSALTNGC